MHEMYGIHTLILLMYLNVMEQTKKTPLNKKNVTYQMCVTCYLPEWMCLIPVIIQK